MFFPLTLTSCLTVSEFSIHLRSVAKNPLRIPGRIEKKMMWTAGHIDDIEVKMPKIGHF